MKSIQISSTQTRVEKPKLFKFGFSHSFKRYLDYATSQEESKIYWYLKAMIVLPNCVMVPTVIAMKMLSSNYLWFIALAMVLFFTTLIVHIAELKSSITVSVYYLSIAIMVLIPVINYLLVL